MSTPPPPTTARNVQYKGAPLDSDKGPGLGCFWSQIVILVLFLVLTPLSVAWGWPTWSSAALLIAVLVLLLLAGQTIIFLLRLVAADRRAAGRRRPLASTSRTVGEIEEAHLGAQPLEDAAASANEAASVSAAASANKSAPAPDTASSGAPDGGVRE